MAPDGGCAPPRRNPDDDFALELEPPDQDADEAAGEQSASPAQRFARSDFFAVRTPFHAPSGAPLDRRNIGLLRRRPFF